MDQQCNSELTPEIKNQLEASPFAAKDIAAMEDEALTIIAKGREPEGWHPVNAIWRIATEGSMTRLGGNVAPVELESKLRLDNGRCASIDPDGDSFTYPDGSTATSEGKASMYKGAGVVLVGSIFDNDDEIISTPQGHIYLAAREGIVRGADLLTVTGA